MEKEVTKAVWYWPKDRHTNQRDGTEKLEINFQSYGQFFFNKGLKLLIGKIIVFSTNGAGATGNPHAENEVGPLPSTLHKNEFKMDQKSKCKD